MREDNISPRRMIDEKQLLEIIPISRSSLWRLQQADKFPRGILVTANKRLFYLDDIVAWQQSYQGFKPQRRGPGRPKKKRRGEPRDQAAGAQ
ncbi:helix-turn-helix transcriptional regulator [Bradyrhizobium cenepequi]